MRQRFWDWLWQYLIAKDQMWAMRVLFFTYVLRGRGKKPNADETISSIVGRHAMRGKKWALLLESRIDALFRWVSGGREQSHCRDSIEYDEFII